MLDLYQKYTDKDGYAKSENIPKFYEESTNIYQ